MDFSQQWKSNFPVGSVFKPPLLISCSSSDAKSQLGPLVFNPVPQSQSHLFSSPSLVCPPLFPPLPQLSLTRFLNTTAFIPLSTSSSVEASFGPEQIDASSGFAHNRLQFLRCPETGDVVVFFPTGDNFDQVGFLILCAEDGRFRVRFCEDGDVFKSWKRSSHPIVRIVVTPIANPGCCDAGDFGYLLAYTLYSVHWFAVRSSGGSEIPGLVYLGGKVFRSCAVVSACWCFELPELSAVLLESGSLFLFDLEGALHGDKLNHNFVGTRLKVSWDHSTSSKSEKWLGCEFAWHPKMLIVARQDAAFLVDFRSHQCIVRCVANIGMSGSYTRLEKDQFLAFSRAGSDGFHFALASNELLILCDVRKPLKPVLQWSHGLDWPSYIDVFTLSELRSNSKNNRYMRASEFGYCILLGSFWNGEFSLFCYGPPLTTITGSIPSKYSEIHDSFYAWGLPSEFLISSHECRSGSCFLNEELLKNSLPEWIDWQQKKDLVLGFGILGGNLVNSALDEDEYGGFTLIRLMSSGWLESQRYSASWEFTKFSKDDAKLTYVDHARCSVVSEDEHKFPRKFMYLKLGYVYSFLKGNLDSVLEQNLSKIGTRPKGNESLPNRHIGLYKILSASGYPFGSSSALTFAFNDIDLPANLGEIVFREKWAGLPIELLLLAFSNYSELGEVLLDQQKASLEFLVVPERPSLPPFILREPSLRSNKWSSRVHRSDAIVGPVLPVSVLSMLNRLHGGSSETSVASSSSGELNQQFSKVMQVAAGISVSDLGGENQVEDFVSLAEDREETWTASQQKKPFLLYEIGSSKPYVHPICSHAISKVFNSEAASSQRTNVTGLEIFDDMCPIKLNFTGGNWDIQPKELAIYKILKRQFLKKQESFEPYQDFLTRCKFQQQ